MSPRPRRSRRSQIHKLSIDVEFKVCAESTLSEPPRNLLIPSVGDPKPIFSFVARANAATVFPALSADRSRTPSFGSASKEIFDSGVTFRPVTASSRLRPFVYAAAVLIVVCVAVLRLPDSFVAQLERNRTLSSSQAGWAYRLLAAAAIGQAAYGGFVILRAERIQKELAKDRKLATMPRYELVLSVARNAATMAVLTLVYGAAALWVTGERGGFWLFPLIAIAQGAWYIRQTGAVAQWLAFQPEPVVGRTPSVWVREPPDYCPPLARGLFRDSKPV